MQQSHNRVIFITTTAVIAALYTALTICLAPISFGLVQCRVSELLTILAAYTPAAVPGLIVGCMLSNLIGLTMGSNIAGALDILLGTLATGVAAWLSWRWRGRRTLGLPVLSTLPPVVTNALIVGTELALVSPVFTLQVWSIQVGLVAAGQAVACIGGGLLLAKVLEKTGAHRILDGKNRTNG
ncbi:MAG: QueT transporter family protein [Clostridia bacterium]|nr:QueT transporter family protein [Clostridia bacterium]